MTVKQALARAREALVADSIEDAPLESELLLRHVLKRDRVQLYLALDHELSFEQDEEFWDLIERRLDRGVRVYRPQEPCVGVCLSQLHDGVGDSLYGVVLVLSAVHRHQHHVGLSGPLDLGLQHRPLEGVKARLAYDGTVLGVNALFDEVL